MSDVGAEFCRDLLKGFIIFFGELDDCFLAFVEVLSEQVVDEGCKIGLAVTTLELQPPDLFHKFRADSYIRASGGWT